MRRTRLVAAAVTVAFMAHAIPAWAEPSARDKETAREVFGQGMEARAAGDTKTAIERITQAHSLAATPIIAFELARTHADVGHLVQAREIALSVARLPVQPNESEKTKQARADAADLAEKLHARIATLSIKIRVTTPGAVATVTLDGAAIAAAAVDAPQRVDPGAHVVTARIGSGGESRVDVTLKDGESREVALEVAAPAGGTGETAPPIPIPPPPVPADTPSSSDRGSTTSPLVWLGFTVAGVGVVAGGITGAIAFSKAGTDNCDGTSCTTTGLSDISSGRSFATISTIAFIIAGVGLGIGIYGLATGGGSSANNKSARGPLPLATGWTF